MAPASPLAPPVLADKREQAVFMGGFPPRRWHAVCRQKALAHISAAASPARGVSKQSAETPLRMPPMGYHRGRVVMVGRKNLRMAATSALTFTTFL